jgi:hypothetical protein
MCEHLFCWRFEPRVSPVLNTQVQSKPLHNLAKFQETFEEETPDNSDGSLELPPKISQKGKVKSFPIASSSESKYVSDPLPLSISVSNDQQNDLSNNDIPLMDPHPDQEQQQTIEHWDPEDLPRSNLDNDCPLGTDDNERYQSDSWQLAEDYAPHEEEVNFEPAHLIEPEAEDPNCYDIWVNYDQEIEPSNDIQQHEYSNFEPDFTSPYVGTEWNDSLHNEEAVFDETFFSTPSLQVLQFDKPYPCVVEEEEEEEEEEEDEGKDITSQRPPRPKKKIATELQSEENQWAWSSEPQPNQRSLRSAYSYSTSHLPLDQSSRPQTAADPFRPLHLTDTVDDGDDEPYEITFSTPSTLFPRIPSPLTSTSRIGTQLKRPQSLPTGLIATNH